jgi:tetrahydromethanopterin S-methyltransferase subunit B
MNDEEKDLYMRGYAKGLFHGMMFALGVMALSLLILLAQIAVELLK